MKKLILAILVPLVCSCQSVSHSGSGSITHVVICWLKNPGDAEARRQLITESKQLRSIPGVLRVAAGTALASTRPIVDSSYDVAIVTTFRSAEDMNHYLTDPRHQRLIKELVKPLVARYIVYDVRESP